MYPLTINKLIITIIAFSISLAGCIHCTQVPPIITSCCNNKITINNNTLLDNSYNTVRISGFFSIPLYFADLYPFRET